MARHAAAARRACAMVGVTLQRRCLARMAVQALPVVEPALERCTVQVTIALGVRVVAVHTRHRPVQVAVAGEMPLLVGEGAYAAVGEIQWVDEQRELQGEVARLQRSLDRVALEADLQRLVLRQGRERWHADVDAGADSARAGELDMAPPRPMAGLAIDGERREPGLVPPAARVERDLDLTAVALLAALETLGAAEDAIGRPVRAVSQRHRLRDRDGAAVRAAERVTEPPLLGSRVIEGQEPHGAVREAAEERLRPAARHEPA